METNIQDRILENIFNTLKSQDFKDWHEGIFEDFITGDLQFDKNITYDESCAYIRADIRKMFHLNNF